MSSIAAANVTPTRESTPMFDRRQMLEMSPVRLSLGQLPKSVGDARKEEVGDGTSVHHFVLSFTNLTYAVKTCREMPLPEVVCRKENGRNATTQTPPPTPAQMDGGDSSSTKTNVLLNNISGEARDGEIMAVLGASGSGKSTLIDALANRISKDSIKGTITLNREPLESRLLKVISAYVMQDDLLFPMLTVEETLMFAADFRLPRTLSKTKKNSRVQALIDQLGLRNAANSIIGDESHRGISGGERRRVSIGIDIIHDPIILFVDEPTSGLDSTNAFMVVKVLKRIAQSGSIVIMSVHQPSYRILGLLDKLIFLSRGHTVFSGSLTNLPQFFADFGYPIPEKDNRTEFALDLIRQLEESPNGTASLVEFNKTWQQTKHNLYPNRDTTTVTLKEAISASISRGKLVSGTTNSIVSSNYANPFWIEVAVLSKRSIINSRRMPMLMVQKLGTGFILATAFWQLDNSPKGFQERIGFFGFAMSTAFYICAEAMPVFIQERYIFMREIAHNAYRSFSYCLSQALVTLLSLISLSLVFSAITFWVVGLRDGSTGFLFYLAIILASFWTGNSFVTFLSGIVPHVLLGYPIVVAILTCFRLLSGFFITRDQIPKYWIWFHYISIVKYPYDAVLLSEFDDPIKCSVKGIQIFDNTPFGKVSEVMKEKLLDNISKTLGMKITNSTCVINGADVLNQQGITDLSKWTCLWITVAWGFFFRILFYFSLLLRSKNKRR